MLRPVQAYFEYHIGYNKGKHTHTETVFFGGISEVKYWNIPHIFFLVLAEF